MKQDDAPNDGKARFITIPDTASEAQRIAIVTANALLACSEAQFDLIRQTIGSGRKVSAILIEIVYTDGQFTRQVFGMPAVLKTIIERYRELLKL